MATERLSMRQIREILRQKWVLGRQPPRGGREPAASASAPSAVVWRATHAGLDWAQVQTLPDEALEARLYGAPAPARRARPRPGPIAPTSTPSGRSPASPWNCSTSSTSSSIPTATATPGSATSTASGSPAPGPVDAPGAPGRREGLRRLRRARSPPHRPATGEVIEVELFVGVLGRQSNYTYAEATRTQQLPDWLGSHARAFAFFGGRHRGRRAATS